MAESFTQVQPNQTGNKIRTRTRTVGANVVHESAVFWPGGETWVAYADAVAFAQNKHHITIFNSDATALVRCKKLFAVNLQSAAVTGVFTRFDARLCSAASVGTLITPVSFDTTNAALPGGVTVRTNGTVTNGSALFPWIATGDEETAVAALSKGMFQQWANILPEGNEIQEITLRQNQGFTIQQTTATAVGSFGWILVFTVEA
ncbi:MAG: hypothetical protein ACREBG_23165 [Pyrinomonadaceae bacterium]